MPYAFFEIEHSTDINHSLLKFFELQDFNAKFHIVAPDHRQKKFHDSINQSVFSSIKDRIKFINYNSVSEMHSNACKQAQLVIV